jgi:hypothetical protein
MAKKQEATTERKVLVTIRSGSKKKTFETWQFWEIVGELQWIGADRMTAYDAAKWVRQLNPGEKQVIPPGIMMEVKEEESQ